MFDYYKTQDYTKPGQYFALRYDTFVNKCVVLGLTPSEDIAVQVLKSQSTWQEGKWVTLE